MGFGVEEKGDRPQTGQDCSGSAWTPLLRPIYLHLPSYHQERQETRAGWWWPRCLVGDPNPILARPRRYFKPQPQAATSAPLAHLWLQRHFPPPSHFLLPTPGPPRLVLGSMCLGETLLSAGLGLSLARRPLSIPSAQPT